MSGDPLVRSAASAMAEGGQALGGQHWLLKPNQPCFPSPAQPTPVHSHNPAPATQDSQSSRRSGTSSCPERSSLPALAPLHPTWHQAAGGGPACTVTSHRTVELLSERMSVASVYTLLVLQLLAQGSSFPKQTLKPPG